MGCRLDILPELYRVDDHGDFALYAGGVAGQGLSLLYLHGVVGAELSLVFHHGDFKEMPRLDTLWDSRGGGVGVAVSLDGLEPIMS